jgi:ABC-type bacteriocin/lantibiotic exporter with double-glycine peptidase domain
MTISKSNIFCPNCGANNNIEQNFCRFCSLHLQETTASLTAQLSFGKNAGQLKKLEWIKKFSDLSSSGLIFSAVPAILIYFYMVFTNTPYAGIKVFYALFVIFLILESVMFYLRRTNTLGYADEMNRKSALMQNKPEKRETAKLLEEKPFEPVPSVTENTTDLLYAEQKTRKL